jgi:hypothetical protein
MRYYVSQGTKVALPFRDASCEAHARKKLSS